MSEIVSTQDLQLGMFVAELDRPWTETTFLLQGFVVENEVELAQLRERCNFVSIDRSRSVGDQYAAPVAAPIAAAPVQARAEMSVVWQKTGSDTPAPAAFFDILRSLGKAPAAAASRSGVAASTADQSVGYDVIDVETGGANAAVARGTRQRMATLRDPLLDRAHAGASAPGAATRAPATAPVSFAGKLTALFPRRKKVTTKTALARNRRLEALVEKQARKSRVAIETGYVDRADVEAELVTSNAAFDRTQDLIADLATEMAKEKMPDVGRIRDAVGGMVESVVRNPDALMWLAKLKRTDNYAYDHALDVSVHLMAFGRHLGLPLAQLNVLGVAGLMQDIGKISLPLDLLKKSAKLTLAEQAVMKRHVEISQRILADQPNMPPEALDIVAKHHERIDGRGYPHGLKGDEIGLFAEMAGIVDTYCAMTSHRAYRPAVDNQHALERLYAKRGRSFSESAVIEFVHCVGIYPVGTLVALNTGEVAVVIAQNRARQLKPRVLVLLAPDKTPHNFPTALDLVYAPEAANGKPYSIFCALPDGAYGLDPQEFYL